ncbi:hypothetical protein AHAS_Ahas17G0293600 [Arachis hypogaea]
MMLVCTPYRRRSLPFPPTLSHWMAPYCDRNSWCCGSTNIFSTRPHGTCFAAGLVL